MKSTLDAFNQVSRLILQLGFENLTSYTEVDSEAPWKTIRIVVLIVLLMVCVLGLTCNVLSVIVFSHPYMRTRAINVFLCGLSIMDFLVLASATLVFGLQPVGNLIYPDQDWSLGPRMQIWLYFFALSAHLCSVWCYVVTTVERYNAVCRPLKGRHLDVRGAVSVLIALSTISLIYNLPRLWEYRIDKDSNEMQHLLKQNKYYMAIYFTSMLWLVRFIIPNGVIMSLNGCIIVHLKRARQTRKAICSQLRSSNDERTTEMILIVTFMFAICSTPALLLGIAETANSGTYDEPIYNSSGKMIGVILHHHMYLLSDLNNLLVVINCSTTFIIYLIYSQRFRELFTKLVKCQLRSFSMRIYRRYKTRYFSDNGIDRWNNNNSGKIADSNCIADTDRRSGIYYSLIKAKGRRPKYWRPRAASTMLCGGSPRRVVKNQAAAV